MADIIFFLGMLTTFCFAGAASRQPQLHPTLAAFILTTMTPKNAALLAFVGTLLMTALLVWNFVSTVVNVLRSVEAPVLLFSSLIYAFGAFTVMVFFFVFYRAQG